MERMVGLIVLEIVRLEELLGTWAEGNIPAVISV